ncbi:helix-turn-helix domain-containing protein [Halobaculum sp. D14]|uniref:helix-turn-helix domain-containing protein n=1 Tax=Halobaculum sp. D14 TaxID=3421642 RepID=UPI003EB71738
MVDSPATTADDPALQDVLDALGDPDCRAILRETTDPMTATDLADACTISKSTLYRKLDLLSRASLVRESIEAGPDGGRVSRYERDVTDVTVSIDVDGDDSNGSDGSAAGGDGDEAGFAVTVSRPARAADERLADMWSTMGDEL